MTRTTNPGLLNATQLERALDELKADQLGELRQRIAGSPVQPFVREIADRVEATGKGAKKIPDAELKAIAIKALLSLQQAAAAAGKKGAKEVNLLTAQKNAGSFGARLLKRLYTQHTKLEGTFERAAPKATHRRTLLESDAPAARAPAGLRPLTHYYREAAGAVPTLEPGEPARAGFREDQARSIFRLYWSAPAYASFEDLILTAQRDPLFKSHEAIQGWNGKLKTEIEKKAFERAQRSLQGLWGAFPSSFPWAWPTRNTIFGSHLLVDAVLKAKKGTSRAAIVEALRPSAPRIPDATAFNNYMSGPWKQHPELYKFLEVLPKDKTGRVILEPQGELDPFQPDGYGRLALTPELGDAVRALAADPRVRWDWAPDDFVRFVHQETGAKAFKWATFLNLRKALAKLNVEFPTWPDVTRAAMERMARQMRAIKDEPEHAGITRKELCALLNSRLGQGEKAWTENQLETVYRNFPKLVGEYIAAKKQSTEDEARALLKALEERKPGETQLDVAAKLGHGEMRAKHLLRVAKELDEAAFNSLGREYTYFSPEDDAALKKGMEKLPIGATPTELYQLLEKEHPSYVERHSLREPKRIAKQVRTRLQLDEDWVTHQQTRLARALADAAAELPSGSSFVEVMERAREQHAIVHDDQVIQNSTYRWKREIKKYPKIAEILDPHGRFPWETLKAPAYGPLMARWAGSYEDIPKPSLGGEATLHSFTQKQVDVLFDLYWSLPPTSDLPDLIEAAKEHRAFAGRDVTSVQVNKLMNELRPSFPWEMRSRNFAIHSLILVEALEQEKANRHVPAVVERLAADHPGFPPLMSFEKAARTRWRTEKDRFPFAARLANKSGEIKLEGLLPADGVRVRGSRLQLDDTLAKRVRELSLSSEIRYDWKSENVRAFIEKSLGVPFKQTSFDVLRRNFNKKGSKIRVPDWEEIRLRARENFVDLMLKLRREEDIQTGAELMQVLHEKHGYPLYPANLLGSLRQEFGDERVPPFREEGKQRTIDECKAYLDAILAAKGKKGIYAIGEGMGWSRQEIYYRLGRIHDLWPKALPGLSPTAPYSEAEKKALRTAIAHSPIGGSVAEVEATLRSESPEFFEQHPLADWRVLYNVIRDKLGITSWRDYQHGRLQKAVADYGKPPRGVRFAEYYQVLRDRYDVAFSEQTVKKLLDAWRKAKPMPEAAKDLLDRQDRYPWEVRVELSDALAQEVAAVMKANPGKTERQIVQILKTDHQFEHDNPEFGVQHIINLRQEYGHIPYVSDLRADAREERAHNDDLHALAARMLVAANAVHDPSGLTPAYFAATLQVEEKEALQAMQRYPAMFPWSRRVERGGNIDIRLASHVGRALEAAPLGSTLEEVVAKLRKDPDFRSLYPSFDVSTVDRLRSDYPNLIPNWHFREQILASRTLVNAILTAEPGTKFETIIKELQHKYPRSYRFPADQREYYLHLWASEPKRFPFVGALRSGNMKPQLSGHGKPPLPKESRSQVERLAREIPQIPDDQPVVRKIAERASPNQFADYEFLCCQHMLGVLVPFMDICASVGMKPSRTTIIGTPYTSNPTVHDVLRDRTWDARRSPLDLGVWKEQVRTAMYERLKSALASGRRIIVLDDGGMVAHLLREDPFLREHAHLFTIVEQTRRGITVAEQDDVVASLINAAQSLSKVFVEGPIIGEVLHEKLQTRLARMGIKSVKGMRIGLIGKGAIGSPLAEELRKMGAIVTGRDTDPDKLSEQEKLLSREDFFQGQDLILGATGQESISAADLALIPDGTIIGSCSSKLVEIDMATLGELAKPPKGRIEVVDDESFPPTVRYHLPDGRAITVLAQGYPLNFDGSVNTTDPDKIQMTRALLFLGLLQATSARSPGIRPLELEGQIEILEYFLTLPAAQADPNLRKAIPETIAKLKAALKDPRAFRTHEPKHIE